MNQILYLEGVHIKYSEFWITLPACGGQPFRETLKTLWAGNWNNLTFSEKLWIWKKGRRAQNGQFPSKPFLKNAQNRSRKGGSLEAPKPFNNNECLQAICSAPHRSGKFARDPRPLFGLNFIQMLLMFGGEGVGVLIARQH